MIETIVLFPDSSRGGAGGGELYWATSDEVLHELILRHRYFC